MEIKGCISSLLKDLDVGNVDKMRMLRESLIGKPINDRYGYKIGEITEINILSDTWYGVITDGLTLETVYSCEICAEP